MRLPGIYCLWLSPSVVNLVTLYSAVRLKLYREGHSISGGGATASLQADATRKGVVCLSKMAPPVWGMTQYRDSGGYSLSSLPKGSVPSLSSGISSPLCPCLCSKLWQVAINENLFIGPLSSSLHLQPSISDREKPCCFLQLDVICVVFQHWCYRLGIPA